MNANDAVFVAALNGSAPGLGAEFAWACDLRVMADGDYFIGQPDVLLGVMPGGGGSQLDVADGRLARRAHFGTIQSRKGQELMLQYSADIQSTGELPLHRSDNYTQALESCRVPGVGSSNGAVKR